MTDDKNNNQDQSNSVTCSTDNEANTLVRVGGPRLLTNGLGLNELEKKYPQNSGNNN